MKTIVASHNPDLARDFDRALLRRRDLRLVTARTSGELLDRLRQGADACFLDRVLPEGDAADALQTIRSDRALGRIPVVMVCGAGSPVEDRRQAQLAGFYDVVELPAPEGALSLLLARMMGVPLRRDRHAVRLPVFELHGGYLGTTVDLSESGLLLRSRRAPEAGTSLRIRFAAPGAPGEISARARVVRSDLPGFTPLKGVALAFDDLDATAAQALQLALQALCTEDYSCQREEDPGGALLAVRGSPETAVDLAPLAAPDAPGRIRLRDLHRLRGDGLQRWIELARALPPAPPTRLIECPTWFITAAGCNPDLLIHQEVESFYAPFTCAACGLEQDLLLQTSTLPQPPRAPEPSCPGCTEPLALDELPERLFLFLS